MNTVYLFPKSLDILVPVIFLGNVIVGWLKTMAKGTKQPGIMAFAQLQVKP
jgi:hypothetical protein